MKPNNRKLLTVVTESVLEQILCDELMELGASGYTVVNARGRGSRTVREAGWDTNSNIRIEVVCESDTADRIIEHLRERYYENYAMILYIADVAVLRPEKF